MENVSGQLDRNIIRITDKEFEVFTDFLKKNFGINCTFL